MPAFYPRQSMPRQLPLTPPEFIPNFYSGCGGMPYQQPAYAGQPGIRSQDDGCDYADRYGQLSIAMPPMYPQAGTYLSNAPPSLPPPSSFYESTGAPILPPMRQSLGDVSLQQHRAQELIQRPAQQPKEEKPVGGVSATLDYEMDVMTDFVCEMAVEIITPGRIMPPSFRKWAHQVLMATRLPSATIILSMSYLSSRMPMLAGIPKNDSHLFRLLTIALVLGSKFLDDNTFINRSWSEVSGIPVVDLDQLEMDWLVAIDFRLHRDPSEHKGWTTWANHWKTYQDRAAERVGRANNLSPIDTSVERRRSVNKPLPPLPMQQAYNTPPYEYVPKSAQPSFNNAPNYSYDPWRSANEYSPASAPTTGPTTGPTTPEYYGATGNWAPEGYTRRTMFGFPPLSQPAPSQPQQHQQPSNYGPPAYPTQCQPPAWNNHGINCGCVYCAQRHPPYFMAPGFGPQAVAV